MIKCIFQSTLITLIGFLMMSCADRSEQYLLSDVAVHKKLNTVARSVVVEKLNLPDYAQDSKITTRGEDGALRAAKNSFWADAPDRALSELLASGLDKNLSASVTTTPWPFENEPDVKLEVKVHQLFGNGDNLNFTGQYFLSSPAGGTLEYVRRFAYTVPINDGGIASLAYARTKAIGMLSVEVSKQISQIRRGQI